MIAYKKDGRIVGILFIAVMAFWSLGYGLIASVLSRPDYLAQLASMANTVFLGSVFEVIEVACVIGIVVLTFPIIKQTSEKMALWYLCFRMVELVLLLIALIIPLVLITLGKHFLLAGSPDNSWYQTAGTLLVALRDKWIHLILPFFFSAASIVFFWVLHRSKLVPRLFSVLGMIGAFLVLLGIPMDYFEFKPGAFVGAVMGLTEIALGIYLVIKGFREPVQLDHSLVQKN